MTRPRRKVLLFGASVIPLFVLFLLVYPFVLSSYRQLVLAGSNLVLKNMSPPLELEINSEGGWQSYFLKARGERQPFYTMTNNNQNLIYLNLALVPALLLATPVSFRRRLRLLGLGLLVLLFFHVFLETALARMHVCLLRENPESFACWWFTSILLRGGQFFGMFEWALLTWPSWFPRSQPDASVELDGKVSRNTPCPCNSGRKFKHCCGA